MVRSSSRMGLAQALNSKVIAVALLTVSSAVMLPLAMAAQPWSPSRSVIVQAEAGQLGRAEQAVRDVHGTVGQQLHVINGFSARVPQLSISRLSTQPGIREVSPDAAVTLQSTSYDQSSDTYSLWNEELITGVTQLHKWGITGKGIDVALIDTGVTPVPGLNASGKVINGPDLSLDSQASGLRYLDSFGHGTFMAGIIAGKDSNWSPSSTTAFGGVAPDARIVNIKVGATNGATDVSQVIAAIDWVIENGTSNGLHIRVINLSLGYDSTQAYTIDPLAYAAEQAFWDGFVVVTAAGNDGTTDGHILSPAYDPWVISVGADDTHGTSDVSDHTVPGFSNLGAVSRGPDLIAPGAHLQSLRVPGSYVDQKFSSGRLGSRFFRGSGTSEAAAFISGLAADILSDYPNLNPFQILTAIHDSPNATIPDVSGQIQGFGPVNATRADVNAPGYDTYYDFSCYYPSTKTTQSCIGATGLGTLEATRGGNHLTLNGVTLSGEKDVFGHTFSTAVWAPLCSDGTAWNGGKWNGTTMTGVTWSGNNWTGVTWSGGTWSGVTWSGGTWSTDAWSGGTWSGGTWSGVTWSGGTWSGGTWSTDAWATSSWS